VHDTSLRLRSLLCAALLAVGLAGAGLPGGTAAATAPSSLDQAAQSFKPYVAKRVAESLAAAHEMRARMAAADLVGAQHAWIAARAGWESAETVADEYFPELDAAIDAWPDATTGFHAIEARLFGAHGTDALPLADKLIENLKTFEEKLGSTSLTAQGILNGTARLAYEIGDSKADGGESPYSGNSFAEIGDNLAGIEEAYGTVFEAALEQADPSSDKAVEGAVDALKALVKASDLHSIDRPRLRRLSEDLVLALTAAAPALGLEKPALGD
jgi:iron uptake system component EfeO